MTTAATPRQPAKRAKGRAQTLHADPYETVVGWQLFADEYDQAVERMARAMLNPERRGLTWGEYRRYNPHRYQAALNDAMAALSGIGIAAPRKERGSR